jgi:Domain of unknown function (DUF2017)
MSSRFRRARSGAITLTLEPVEAAVLANLIGQIITLLKDGDDREHSSAESTDDPLAAALGTGFGFGLDHGPVRPPEDEVLARLLPEGYRDDPEAAAEFRRFTERDLRARKIAVASTVLSTLGSGGKITLDADRAQAWLLLLNDLRLAIGTRLSIAEDYEAVAASLTPDDPQLPMYELYEWLTWLQDSLVRALAGDL